LQLTFQFMMTRLPALRHILPALLLATSACTPQLAYQVLETHAATSSANPDVLLDYNFWNEGGVVACTVRNQTDAPLYVDLNRTQLIINGLAQDYYSDEQQTTTIARGRSMATAYASPWLGYYTPGSASTQSSNSRTLHAKPLLQVPPRAAIVIGGLSAVPTRLFHCDLEKWRSSKPATVAFTEEASPLKFRQFLTYSRRPDGSDARTIDHAFWVEKVSNMSLASFQGNRVRDESCGRKLATSHGAMPYAKAGNLYVAFRPASPL
jgi:hypothetical protein